MKKINLPSKSALKFFALCITDLALQIVVFAQCNVNVKYDKIESGYHSSIAMKTDGSFAIWGQATQNDGVSDYLVPNNLNSSNFPALTGTPLKATIGGPGGGGKDQQILLASDGLYAWGNPGGVLSTSIASTAAFKKITINGNTNGLPTGILPSDINMLFATNQTLAILTNSGSVYMITQANNAVQGDSATLSSTTWHQVKINSSTYLANIVAIRGEVSNANYSAMVAVSSRGSVYTWGKTTYLGNGTASAARYYANQMTIPSEFSSSSIPVMAAVTGGISGTSTTKNTYYLIGNSGALYALGDNTQNQCGDFTTTERTSWVNAKINASTNFTNITFISAQDHDGAYPGIAAITSDGSLYTWGNNGGDQLGEPTQNTAYNPSIPGGFNLGTDQALFAELGGHTLVYLKAGSSQFCYVGHKTNGSMGDNVSASSNITSFDCTGTPSINICGYVPVVASLSNSIITASQSVIQSNGTSTSVITVRLKDASGNYLTVSGGVVTITSSFGSLSAVADSNNGSYSAILTSAASPGLATLGFTINGSAGMSSTSVNFVSTLPVTWSDALAFRKGNTVVVQWSTQMELNIANFTVERSEDGVNWTSIADKIQPKNNSTSNSYSSTDLNYYAGILFYRVQETDLNGQSSYSTIIEVPADGSTDKIILYPVPAYSKFYLQSSDPNQITDIEIFSMSGQLMMKWNNEQASYDINSLPKGLYTVEVNLSNMKKQILRLQKM